MPKKRNATPQTASASDDRTSKNISSETVSITDTEGNDEFSPTGNGIELTNVERRVFLAFRRYLMTPGHMLCFNPQEQGSLKKGLDSLLKRGFLVAESTKGAFSLTAEGYAAMKGSKQ